MVGGVCHVWKIIPIDQMNQETAEEYKKRLMKIKSIPTVFKGSRNEPNIDITNLLNQDQYWPNSSSSNRKCITSANCVGTRLRKFLEKVVDKFSSNSIKKSFESKVTPLENAKGKIIKKCKRNKRNDIFQNGFDNRLNTNVQGELNTDIQDQLNINNVQGELYTNIQDQLNTNVQDQLNTNNIHEKQSTDITNIESIRNPIKDNIRMNLHFYWSLPTTKLTKIKILRDISLQDFQKKVATYFSNIFHYNEVVLIVNTNRFNTQEDQIRLYNVCEEINAYDVIIYVNFIEYLMLKPKAISLVLKQATTGGSPLAFVSDSDREARVYAAITSNIWNTIEKNVKSVMDGNALKFLLVGCEEGNVVITTVNNNMFLCLVAKPEIDALTKHLEEPFQQAASYM
ncbi:2522_t:CDS:2 [Diversispora eburnea]|uniref:2522_t:CDS:1 n=1 Tax=Diversispora eburnea TaxID=1213867 RepID=A0A9N8YXR0_9GLOM|nr:2522_t:CDS:2 [Diversispora eburnea]